jgi:3-methyladenine DNA glycosylase AlkD
LKGQTQSGDSVLRRLKSLSNPKSLEGMARFGINTKRAFGVSIPQLRALSKEIGKDHLLAQQLWDSQFHEARMLATMIDDPRMVSEAQMEAWVGDFDSWDVCDQCCGNLFDKTELAYRKAVEWGSRDEQFVKRAGFALMAWLAVHDKKARDEEFVKFLSIIEGSSTDDRNFVKKAVNWALRQIGKRNRKLNEDAIGAARRISRADSKAAKWIASDALRELTSEAVKSRVRSRASKPC